MFTQKVFGQSIGKNSNGSLFSAETKTLRVYEATD
jgi:hypothetical protein